MKSEYLEGVWKEGGRTWPEVDCYGLVLKVRSDKGLPEWPEWGHARRGDGSMQEVWNTFLDDLTRCDPHPGAMAACYSGSVMSHVTVVDDDNGVLCSIEINEGTGVICLPLPRLERRFTRVEYYK